ncbi:MAG: hypothetical protein Q8O67_22700 [Deltaproteobacteria bacterium]|nr:hypothetical protein [Deltaproteobacteria bacterium]
MTTTTSTRSNPPAFELFSIEEKPADRAAAAKKGKSLPENATERVWTRVGVAFPTKSGSGALAIIIGDRGDARQKRYLMCPTSALDEALENKGDSNSRIPVGELFELSDGPIDFKRKAGVAFLCSDGSYNIVLGDRGDLEQSRYNMRRPKSAQRKSAPRAA